MDLRIICAYVCREDSANGYNLLTDSNDLEVEINIDRENDSKLPYRENDPTIFLEINIGRERKLMVMDIRCVTSTNDDQQGHAILLKFGMPFRKKNVRAIWQKNLQSLEITKE
jgi:hypothetical protein